MSKSRSILLAIAASTVFAPACVAAQPDTDTEAIGLAEGTILWTNGDSPTFFWQPSTIAALQQLASGSLRGTDGEMASTSLLSSDNGRSLLHYVVGCALPPGETLASTAAGVSFDGAVGLAASWATQPLNTTASQRWMTACLLQTLNGLGVHVPIRMVGSHSALADSPGGDVSDFNISEATAFGNIFVPGQERAYACVDIPLGLSCGVEWSTYSLERLCGASPTCGITPLTLCSLNCTRDAAGNATCKPLLLGPTYSETISVKLDETGSLSLYPLCLLP